MIKQIGSQRREPIEDTVYRRDYKKGHDVFLFNRETGKREKWTENDKYAGYVIEIDGVGFEFVCEL